jgi:hypothetical protein
VKYERTESFKRDYQRLDSSEREEFKDAVRNSFVPAAEKLAVQEGSDPWPPKLRVKGVQGATGVWEMTWSFKDPDGRATFEWVQVDGEPAIRWRRVGSHAIFKHP